MVHSERPRPDFTVERLVEKGLRGGPSETSEQISLFRRLRRARLFAYAVPNGGSRRRTEGGRLKLAGVEEGVPDVRIETPTELAPKGVALEMKRADGTPGDVTPEQWEKLAAHEANGVVPMVGYGWRDAVAKLRLLGYVLGLLLALSRPISASPLPSYQSRALGSLTGSYGLDAELVLAGWIADVDPRFFSAVTWTESRWEGRKAGDGGASRGLWQITASAIRSLDRSLDRATARELAETPFVRSIVAGLYWRRLVERYGRRFAASVYTCGPKCRGITSTRTSRAYRRHYRRLGGSK